MLWITHLSVAIAAFVAGWISKAKFGATADAIAVDIKKK